MLKVAISKLRENIYQLLDSVIKTGQPIEVERKGHRLVISRAEPINRLARLEKKKVMKVRPEELVHIDWSSEWKPRIK